MNKWVLLFLQFISIYLPAQSNKCFIEGIIKTSSGHPAELVNVSLKGTSIGSVTDENGEYEIKNLMPGKYTLKISSVGFETIEIEALLEPGETFHVPDIILKEKAKELEEVVIQDQTNKFAIQESEYIAKLPIKNIENPQSYSTATQAFLIEQNITDYSSALEIIPGGVTSSESGIGLSAAYVRGFLTYSYIRNGIYSLSPSGGDPQVIERIEIIRGPSGPIFGTSGVSYGGLINRVTKKPFDQKYINAGLTFGSFNLQRYTADINLPLNEEKSLLFRVNAALHSEGSFQDYGYKKTYLLAPSFYYKIDDNLNILLEAEINNIDLSAQTYFLGASGLGLNRIDEINRDYFKSYSSNSLTHPPSTLNNYYGKINYKISNNWELSVNISLSDFLLNGTNIIPTFLNDTLMSRAAYDYNGQYNTINIQPNLTGDFFIGNFKNRFVAGLDYKYAESTIDQKLNLSVDTLNYTKGLTPTLNVEKIRSNYDLLLSTNEGGNVYSIYFSNVINFTELLNFMVSLRYEYFDSKGEDNLITGQITNSYTQDALTPQLGATYQLLKNKLSLFANFMQGFNFVAPNTQGQSFKPEFAEQIEAGIKLDLLDRKITSTISYYNISVEDKVRIDRNNPLLSIQDGTQISEGLDIDLRINPLPNLNIVSGYSYNYSKFTKANQNIEGKHPIGTPKNTANIWGSYTFDEFLKGIGIGMGIIYTDDYFYDDENTLTIPSYTLLKGTLFYDSSKLRISVAMENITNKKYWDFNGTPQMPRRILLSLSFNIK